MWSFLPPFPDKHGARRASAHAPPAHFNAGPLCVAGAGGDAGIADQFLLGHHEPPSGAQPDCASRAPVGADVDCPAHIAPMDFKISTMDNPVKAPAATAASRSMHVMDHLKTGFHHQGRATARCLVRTLLACCNRRHCRLIGLLPCRQAGSVRHGTGR